MKRSASGLVRSLLLLLVVLPPLTLPRHARAQGGYNDNRVMIQGFIWESHHPQWAERWYRHVRDHAQELADAEFDIIWLPPPSEGEGAGYHPRQLNDFDNNYGSLDDHKQVLRTLLEKGIEPVADIVVNHRNGTDGWAVFRNPDWPAKFICETDEFWYQPLSEPTLSNGDRAILMSPDPGAKDFGDSNWPNWHGARDLDHTNENVRREVNAYLDRLKAFGYRGWRYDMVKGYAPEYVAEYNFRSKPTIAVGEYLDSNVNTLTGWIDATKQVGQNDPAERACSAFDFTTKEKLQHMLHNEEYPRLQAISFKDGQEDGLIAVNRDKAVTFLENHDTGWPQQQFDSFPNDRKLLQGYAFILTHPGMPCVYWKHYFDWQRGGEIRRLVKARKYAGVHSGSFIKTEVHGNDYVAIVGDKPEESSTLIVKIGRGFAFDVDRNVWGLETSGDGYAVWVRKSKKAETQAAVDGPKASLPVPGQ